MVVISISLSGTELKEFDNITNKLGFSSRSDAVREALHRFVAQNKWIEHLDNSSPFIATIVYDDKREQPVHNVIHDFKNIVKSSTHTHFGDRCAEWVILQGDGEIIKQFVESLSAIKDVMVCRCSV
ncbi:MAG: CopG family ribbon-helix-helix protein [Candidatus Methanoperedens sp.]|nr:CopG family ribbon-helix-helix protein [Candidatus Methanoperedens sp.]